jgi:hypothetical protein
VLLSIKPKYVKSIIEGDKRYEFRKTIFKNREINRIYIYSSSPVKKIVGTFEIGGRYTDPGLLFPDGTVNYKKVQNAEKFQEGINEVLSIISSGKKIALMCAEKEPERCHRFALISPVLQSRGISVIHIRPDMKLQANEDLERELVDSFFDTSQVSITGEPVDFVALMYERVRRGIGIKRKEP